MKGAQIPNTLPMALASEMGSSIGMLSPAKKWVRNDTNYKSTKNNRQSHASGRSDDKESPATVTPAADAVVNHPAVASSEHEHHHHHKKKNKKKKRKAKIPKGFYIVKEGGDVYHNSANGWYYDVVNLHYYKSKSGPFYMYDVGQKKLVPTKSDV